MQRRNEMTPNILDAIHTTVEQCHDSSQISGLAVSLAVDRGPDRDAGFGCR